MDLPPISAPLPSAPAPERPGRADDAALRTLAQQFEAQFVAEMLKHSGLNQAPSGFGGGPGEEAFASFLTDAYAKKLVDAGGVGLAEAIYRSMLAQGDST